MTGGPVPGPVPGTDPVPVLALCRALARAGVLAPGGLTGRGEASLSARTAAADGHIG